MAVHIFTGNVIAIIWDFDQTLIPGYQQKPLFEEYGVDEATFWAEVRALTERYSEQHLQVSKDTAYLNHLLTYVREEKLPGLSNAKLRELGGRLHFYPGMPEFMKLCKEEVENNPEFAKQSITLEHYIVSTGMRQIILGSAVSEHVRDVWACEFIESPLPSGFLGNPKEVPAPADTTISQICYFLDNTTKTRAIWEINKGTNVDPQVGVNDLISPEDRRVPPRNMLYVADGPSDVPVFSILNQYGGRTLGVYNPDQEEHFLAVKHLRDQGRVQMAAEANYEQTSTASRWILASLREMAAAIVKDRERALVDRVQPSVGHVT